MELTSHERAYYSRQMILPDFGAAGQTRLKEAKVLLVGLGGLGSPTALYLAGAGIGTLGLCDNDHVAVHNLHRQVLHSMDAVDGRKTESARQRLASLNPAVQLVCHDRGINPANARELVRSYDLVVDGSDNFPTRYLVNDACGLEKRRLVSGSIFQFEGQVSLFHAPDGPCLRCLFPEMPAPGSVPNCAEAGVLGPLCGMIGSTLAMETVKGILGMQGTLSGRLLTLDARNTRWRELKVRRDPTCPLCGDAPAITEIDPAAYEPPTCAAPPVQDEALPWEISVRETAERSAELLLLDVREPVEWDIAHLPGAQLLPLGHLAETRPNLPRDRPIVTYCHHGMRSLAAARLLRERGYAATQSMAGGIDAWSREIDPNLPRY